MNLKPQVNAKRHTCTHSNGPKTNKYTCNNVELIGGLGYDSIFILIDELVEKIAADTK